METSVRNGLYLLRGWLVKTYLRMHGCTVGKRFRCVGFPIFRYVPNGNYEIGDNVSLGTGVVLEVTPKGRLQLDQFALIGDYCTISASHSIHLKKWCALAERASLRDHFHNMEANEPYRKQPSNGSPIVMGEDSGVGAGVVVLKGANIPDGTFIGANAVVTHRDELEEFAIYAGNPLKLVRKR